ncbi:MAG: DUF4832 domain-containing protein [Polyangiales bacterium]
MTAAVAVWWLLADVARSPFATPDTVSSAPEAMAPEAFPAGTTTTKPGRIDDVLTNPGMGFASFHFGWWCNLPPITYPPEECAKRIRQHRPENYPKPGTAYFRWFWRDLEPTRGQIDFELIDATIQSANEAGMTLSFRVMTVEEGKSGLPEWLTTESGQWRDGSGGSTYWPDYRDDTFQREHARFIAALGKRYNGHPAVDHIDIGTVGCWGEWNTACLTDVDSIVEVYKPSGRKARAEIKAAMTRLIDHHLKAFPDTPVIMLGLEADHADLMVHATRGGAGWRADCWGDWGLWGGSWNHQEKLYPAMISAATKADPAFADVWKRAPVQLEICGTLERWHELGWTTSKPDGVVTKTFAWALDHHASLLNAKSKPVPKTYVGAIDGLLTRVGYRLVVDQFNHEEVVHPGDTTTFLSNWRNLGVAPAYRPRTLTYRLRSRSTTVTHTSRADIRTWLPGTTRVRDDVTIPPDLPPGTYPVEVALLDRPGTAPDTKALPPTHLGMAGRTQDGWYPVAELTVVESPPAAEPTPQ